MYHNNIVYITRVMSYSLLYHTNNIVDSRISFLENVWKKNYSIQIHAIFFFHITVNLVLKTKDVLLLTASQWLQVAVKSSHIIAYMLLYSQSITKYNIRIGSVLLGTREKNIIIIHLKALTKCNYWKCGCFKTVQRA